MFRRLSASTFLLGMALLVLLKQPVLAYCDCSQSFYIAECHCCSPVETTCPCSEKEAPCDDCGKALSLEVDDHFWEALKPLSAPEFKAEDSGNFTSLTLSRADPGIAFSIARPPPLAGRRPLFLTLGVLRL